MEQEQKKKMTWLYNLVNHVATAMFPTGEQKIFNLAKLVEGMSMTQELMTYYGFKQWVSSNAAEFKTAADKITSFVADYTELTTHGLELSGEGQIKILGSSGSGKKADVVKIKKSDLAAHTDVKMLQAMKLLGIMLTPEQEELVKNAE